MNIATFAARNIIRNSHRTLVTSLAMAFACAMMIMFATLMEGLVAGSERSIVAMNTGDIQIHRFGYRDNPDIYDVVEHASALAAHIREAGFNVTERQFAFGLMASDDSASGVQLRGVDLEFENSVTELDQHIQKGQWLATSDPHGVVIGKKLARLLDVQLNDELVFVGQTADGFMANDTFYIRGILKSVSANIDNAAVFMSNQMLRELIALPDDAHELVIMRQDNQDLNEATQQIQMIASDYEVLSWPKLLPVIYQFLETAHVQTLIMMLFTYIAVGSVVLNAMLMSVFERIHEFGVMKAVGVGPWQLIKLIYAEMMIQVVIASVIGVIVGGTASLYFQQYGIDLSTIADDFSFAGLALDSIWYALITLESIVMPVVFLVVIAVIAVIYPAAKVAMLKPIDAIHHV
ncbi:MAG: ABC transporter permease [Gammaproteobacteria bacterium]|nr:ABC transporter permease [Gammaproteobacteria bacterium]